MSKKWQVPEPASAAWIKVYKRDTLFELQKFMTSIATPFFFKRIPNSS
jgi:hypothetical protein